MSTHWRILFPLLAILFIISCYFEKGRSNLSTKPTPIPQQDLSAPGFAPPESVPPAVGVLPEGSAPVVPSQIDAPPPPTVTPEETAPAEAVPENPPPQ